MFLAHGYLNIFCRFSIRRVFYLATLLVHALLKRKKYSGFWGAKVFQNDQLWANLFLIFLSGILL